MSEEKQDSIWLEKQEYLDDFDLEADSISSSAFKIEAIQSFQEPGVESWEQFQKGNLKAAKKAADQILESGDKFLSNLQSRGINFARIRFVRRPITPYLQWELSALKRRSSLGEVIYVCILSEDSRGPESFPEAVVFDEKLGYEVVYDNEGVSRGAYKHINDDFVSEAASIFETYKPESIPLAEYEERFPGDILF